MEQDRKSTCLYISKKRKNLQVHCSSNSISGNYSKARDKLGTKMFIVALFPGNN